MRNVKQAGYFVLLPLFVFFISCGGQKEHREETENVFAGTDEKPAAPENNAGINNFEANVATEIGKKVLSIFQDKKNNYWFGTQSSGVYRYDGKTLIQFTEKDGLFRNQVQDIQEDESGKIWFTTGGYGISCFDGQKITTLKSNNNPEKNWTTTYGDLWFYAGGGAYRYANDSLAYLPFPKADSDSHHMQGSANESGRYGVYCILKDKSGNLWFGTQAMGVCRYDGKSFMWLTEKGLAGPAVLAIFEDSRGNLWFGNNGKGLFRYDGKSLTNITEENGLTNPEFIKTGKSGPGTLARPWAINEDNNGNIWIGTADAGAWTYDGKKLTNYTAKDGLPDKAIETIYKDKNGELWFGSDEVYKFNGKSFTPFLTGSGR